MKEAWYRQVLHRKGYERKLFFILASILLTSNLLLSLKILLRSDRLILVPPTFSKELWVKGQEGSPAYLHEMALYVAHLLLDRSAQSMAFQDATLLRYVAPYAVSSFQIKLKDDEAFYRDNALSTMFHTTHVRHDPALKEVHLKGLLTQMESSKIVQTIEQAYTLAYTFQDGFFQVLTFSQDKEGKV